MSSHPLDTNGPVRARRHRQSRWTGWGLVLGLVLHSGAAQAKQVWANEAETRVLEVGGFYKALGAGMVLPDGLVANMDALARAVEEARESLPTSVAATLPLFEPMPGEGALSTQVARLQARLLWGEHLDAEVAWQLGASVASAPAFAGGAALGGSPMSGAATASRRLVDFDPALAESGTMRLRHDLDRLSLKLSFPGVDVVAGRQVLGWGSGRLWNPTDLLSPFSPTDIDKEVRKGVDALRVSMPLGVTGLLDLLWLPQRRAEENGGVVRAQANFFGYDFSLSAAKYLSDLVFGADFSGDLGRLGVHGEAAWTLGMAGWSEGPLKVDEQFVRAVGGVEWRPLESLVLMAEYHFNGFGASTPEEYLAKMQSARVARGEVFGAGRHYLGLVSSWAVSELVALQTTALVNLQDPSAMLVPVVEWSAAQGVLLRVGAFLPLGKGPDQKAFQDLGASDVLEASPAFQSASSTLGVRSEYGMAAAGLMAQVAIHL